MDENLWLNKIEETKKGSADLSRDEDLSIALMNLISLEEHFYFTAMKTQNQSYLDMLYSTREMRKTLMKKIVSDPKGEEWCISKHLLAASMRLVEVGTKELQKNRAEAERMFSFAFNLFSLFFAINMKIVEMKELKGDDLEGSKLGKFSEIVKKIVDCCKE
ncbi:MAG: hypothetical protein HY362_04615 [Candidatus Aenigmarchaeota archaeon]|nr:hypothetical protein [Candidatus Aenigmarchaeota archaeon]